MVGSGLELVAVGGRGVATGDDGNAQPTIRPAITQIQTSILTPRWS